MNESEKNNLRALAIGLGLIVFVAILFILRNNFSKENNTVSSGQIGNQTGEQYSGISAKDLLQRMASHEKILILDIRSSDSFNAEHIKDSVNISLDGSSSYLNTLDKNGEYVIVDDTAQTTAEIQAIEYLKSIGFKNIFYLNEGMIGWTNNFYPAISAGDPYSLADQAKVNYISSDNLNKFLNQNQNNNLYLIDVRTEKEYSEGHLKNSVNIYLDDLESHRDSIPMGKSIVVYDNDGLWAFQAAVRLSDMGFMGVFSLSDGLNAWKQKTYPVVK